MPYATIQDVFARFPVNTLVGTGTNDITSLEVTSTYIRGAESVVNGFLGAKYVLPLTADPLVNLITTDLAIFDMLAERTGRAPQAVETRYGRVMNYLEPLRVGKRVLDPQPQSVTTSGDSFAFSTTQSYHQIFSPVLDALDQRVDQTWVDFDKGVREDDAC